MNKVKGYYIIKVETKDYKAYVLSKKALNKRGYVEVFRGDIIPQESIVDIKPLKVFCPQTLKAFESENDLIKYYASLQQYLNRTPNSDRTLFEETLDVYAADYFPKEGAWSSTCFQRPNDEIRCHLRDTEWLANDIMQKLSLSNDYYLRLLAYLNDSEVFETYRSECEQRIIKWQIEWMLSGGEGWLVDPMYGGDFYQFHRDCDKAFRDGIVRTLTAIGMNKEQVEKGIELNQVLWRPRMQNRSFLNHHNGDNPFSIHDDGILSDDYRKAWLTLREYDYYKEHKSAVDSAKVYTDPMYLTDEQVEVLREYGEEGYKKVQEYFQTHKPRPFVLKID